MNLQQSDFCLPFISSEKESQYKLADPEPGFQDADQADASEQADGSAWKMLFHFIRQKESLCTVNLAEKCSVLKATPVSI